jgi:butyrate kinase
MAFKILVINPGSTSTKLAVYEDSAELLRQNITHSAQELSRFAGVIDQMEYRYEQIKEFLDSNKLAINDFSAIAARGGLMNPIPSGTYRVNDLMLEHLRAEPYGSHASNLGGLLAARLVEGTRIPAFIVDPVVVDEMASVARITGRPEIMRKSLFHALNQKAVAKRLAAGINRHYNELNLIVAHLGGGISVGCHKKGRVVEVNNALDGEGPFSPERAGSMQTGQFCRLVAEKGWTQPQISKALAGEGGLIAHLGTSDAREIESRMASGDENAKLVYDAMIYQVAKYIALSAVPVCGQVDYIILTGGIAHSKLLTGKIEEYVKFIAPVVVMPGEDELQALAEGAFRVLCCQEIAGEYR